MLEGFSLLSALSFWDTRTLSVPTWGYVLALAYFGMTTEYSIFQLPFLIVGLCFYKKIAIADTLLLVILLGHFEGTYVGIFIFLCGFIALLHQWRSGGKFIPFMLPLSWAYILTKVGSIIYNHSL